MTIKLGDLRAQRAAVAGVVLTHAVVNRGGEQAADYVFAAGLSIAVGSDGEDADFDGPMAVGLVATHNAADALIEVVEACLRYEAALHRHAKVFSKWAVASGATSGRGQSKPGGYEEELRAVDTAATEVEACRKARFLAFSKVSL